TPEVLRICLAGQIGARVREWGCRNAGYTLLVTVRVLAHDGGRGRRTAATDSPPRKPTAYERRGDTGRRLIVQHRRLGSDRDRVATKSLDLLEYDVQAVAFDELHGVIMNASMLAHAENRHDVGMVQVRSRPGLAVKALQLRRIEQGMKREHLEGDVPAQRFLHRFVNHPHPTPPPLPHNVTFAPLSPHLT